MSLRSLMNAEPPVNPKFNSDGYKRFIAENLTIVDKHKLEVPFELKAAQLDLLTNMQQYLLILILKARKMGFSSAALGVAVAKFLLGKNEKCVTMSFDQGSAEKQLARAKHFIRSYERINGVTVPLKYNSTHEMVYEAPGGEYTNTLRVGTARSNSFGRGDDITFLHLTEVAFCADIELLLAGVGEAVVANSHIILETTANGFNSYKTFWDDSMMGKKGFANLFYSPGWEYDAAYLNVRRMKLGRLFNQEYPMSPEEAFIASGQTYIENSALATLLETVKLWEESHVQAF